MANVALDEDLRSEFLHVHSRLKSELLEDPAIDSTDYSRKWVEQMLDHSVSRGNSHGVLSVIDSYKLLKGKKDLTKDEFFLACALGWCTEWMEAYFNGIDDIVEKSHAQLGQPFRSTPPEVGLISANDGFILRFYIPKLISRHFKNRSCYTDLLDLFNEVDFQNSSGRMLYLTAITQEGEKDLSKYTMPLYRHIVQCKTAYCRFYLPMIDGLVNLFPYAVVRRHWIFQSLSRRMFHVACALLMSGANLDGFDSVKEILFKMGILYQVQNDYLNCFGDPKNIGSDIEDFRCSWLVVQALDRADERQIKILYENYGKADPKCVKHIKDLYTELDLQKVFLEYRASSKKKLLSSIDAEKSMSVQGVLKYFLDKMSQ